MAFTQTQLDAIDTAIASGELSVTYDGRSVTYRSLDDLLKARALIVKQINSTIDRRSYAEFNRGT